MRLTLLQKLVISFSLVFCLIIAGFGFLVLQSSSERYQAQSDAYCRKIVEANIALSDHYFEQLRNIANIVAKDQDIISAVTYRERASSVNYAVELYNQRRVAAKLDQLRGLSGVTSALLIGSNGECYYSYGASPVRSFDFNHEKWFTQSADSGQSVFVNFHPLEYLLNEKRKQSISLIAPILNSNQYFSGKAAYFLCDFELSPILIAAGRDDDTDIAVYDGGTPVYAPAQSKLSKAQQQLLNLALMNGEKNVILPSDYDSESAYLVVNERSRISGWSIVGIMSLKSVERMHSLNKMFVMGLMFVAFAVTLIASTLLARSVLIPMNRLMVAFQNIGNGEKRVQFEETSSVEVDRIAHTANLMFDRIEKLTNRVMEEGKERAQAQLRALQHQINPHFLNNVLQSMKALAVRGDTDTISKMCTLLGKLLTYSVYNPYDMVSIKSEFEYTDHYIALQNMRFERKITCTLDFSPQVQDFSVPKLIIQPLAENAIEHGCTIDEGGHITLSADMDGNEVYIAVTNTGLALSAQRVEELNYMIHNRKANAQTKSIGLLNVAERLKSCFGDAADLQIFSRSGMNTSIVITIPVEKEGD